MHLKILSGICFNLDQSKILSPGNGLTYSPNSVVFKGPQERRHFKHCGKMRKFWEPAFSPLHHVYNQSIKKNLSFDVILLSAYALSLDESKM